MTETMTLPDYDALTPLREAFAPHFPIGAVLGSRALQGQEAAEVSLASRHFSALTAENSMKPEALQPAEGRFTYDGADRLVELAEACGAVPVGHTLVWRAQTPAWFFAGSDTQPVGRDLALDRLHTHIIAVVSRYRGHVKEWDVVNEAIIDAPGGWPQPSPWREAIGDDFIAEAFRTAHAADPAATLIYNDYNIELRDKRAKTLQLLRMLLGHEVPIHAVGIQGHWRLDTLDLAEIEEAILEYAALGLKVIITELDIGVLPTEYQGADISVHETLTPEMNPYVERLPEAVVRRQAERYQRLFAMLLRHKDVIGRVTLWGTDDGNSWLNDFPIRGRTDYPLLFDRERQPKPAFFAVQQAALAAR